MNHENQPSALPPDSVNDSDSTESLPADGNTPKGWRLLGPHERIIEGDRFLNHFESIGPIGWTPAYSIGYTPAHNHVGAAYIRKLPVRKAEGSPQLSNVVNPLTDHETLIQVDAQGKRLPSAQPAIAERVREAILRVVEDHEREVGHIIHRADLLSRILSAILPLIQDNQS